MRNEGQQKGEVVEGKIKLRPTGAQKVCLHIGLARHTSRCAVGQSRPPRKAGATDLFSSQESV
jgi:hypothetical protein